MLDFLEDMQQSKSGNSTPLLVHCRYCARYYARRLNVTEARLNDLCRRMANQSSKELIHDRLVQEARRLLRFSAIPVSEIGYQLGFTDPAYFSRFFTRHAGVPPSEFRSRQSISAEL